LIIQKAVAPMFKSFYGMTRNPFDKQSLSDKDAFMSKDHKETTDRLNYLKSIRGAGVFTASPGYGKTFSLRCFSNSLDRNLYEAAYICLSTVSFSEFYRQFCNALGIEPSFQKSAMFKAVQDRLFHLFKVKKKPFILFLDEAHYLSDPILTDLKMIMNHEYDSLNCFTVVLAGEPHLNRTLCKPIHEALRQRAVIHYSYSGLSDSETENYLRHKLHIAGACDSILGEGTLPAVSSFAGGCPRLVDNLMNQALSLGAQLEKTCLDPDIIMAAVNNLKLG
jgi:type II secretory pathway predicted ATPase ExeA